MLTGCIGINLGFFYRTKLDYIAFDLIITDSFIENKYMKTIFCFTKNVQKLFFFYYIFDKYNLLMFISD